MVRFMSDAPLGQCCTFLTGGKAKRLAFAYTVSELIELGMMGALVIGRGSNVLFGDAGYNGVVAVNRTHGIEFDGGVCVCESGALMARLAREYAERGLTGLEWAYGLPGSLGGAAVGNAGAFGGCIADVIIGVDVLEDGKKRTLYADECGFGYRKSAISGTVLSLTLKAERGDAAQIRERCESNLKARRSKQPAGASGGSVFKAADSVPAGKLIEQAGLKGLTCGGAEISGKHANFIINRGGATSGDILTLMNVASAEVYNRFGIKLEREIKLLGDFF